MTDHGIARDQLRAFIERIERLEEEKKAIADDIREVYAEAKGSGFTPAIMREIVKLRKKDANERAEHEAVLDLYLHALGMAPEPDGDDDAPRGSRSNQVTTHTASASAPLRSETTASVTAPVSKIVAGMEEALSVAKGDAEPYAIHEPQVAPQPVQSLPETPLVASPSTEQGGDESSVTHPVAKAEEGVSAEDGGASVDTAGRPDAGRSASATSERMDVTAGETATSIVQFHQDETREQRALRLRPHCQRPSACAGVGATHCYSCKRAITAFDGGDTA